MTQETYLIRLIRDWDTQVPASDHATTLLLIIQELRTQIEELEASLREAGIPVLTKVIR